MVKTSVFIVAEDAGILLPHSVAADRRYFIRKMRNLPGEESQNISFPEMAWCGKMPSNSARHSRNNDRKGRIAAGDHAPQQGSPDLSDA
ncbi:MAG: hypothetical protein JXA71_19900 [Chitinispirillaceae bacterium]|nr:hypothetical protein [Chitinispirillaceae bacterium]